MPPLKIQKIHLPTVELPLDMIFQTVHYEGEFRALNSLNTYPAVACRDY